MKRVKVIGGHREIHEEGEGIRKKTWSSFQEKKAVVIEEKDLASLFRRGEFEGLTAFRVEETREPLTPGYLFSAIPSP